VNAVDHIASATPELFEDRRELDRFERGILQCPQQGDRDQHRNAEHDRHQQRRLRGCPDFEHRREREHDHSREERKGMPHDRVVPEQVEPWRVRRRSKLHDEKQHRVHDADEGHEAGTDRQQHVGRAARRHRGAQRDPGDDQSESDGGGDVHELHDARAQTPALLQGRAEAPPAPTEPCPSGDDWRIDLATRRSTSGAAGCARQRYWRPIAIRISAALSVINSPLTSRIAVCSAPVKRNGAMSLGLIGGPGLAP
jgi:hypothetical protein